MLVAQAPRFPELGRTFFASGPGPSAKALGQYLQGLTQQGLLAIEDPELAAYQFVGMCEAGLTLTAHMQVNTPTDSEIERVVGSAVRLFLAGYAAR